MMKSYLKLMRFDKPIGIFLLLWPALWALWLATAGEPDTHIVVIFILGTIVMRAAGCVINDIADRKIDKYVERTKRRPLTSGDISLRGAVTLFLCLCLLALILVLQLNQLTILLSCSALFFTGLYPFTKRFMSTPQIILGIAFSVAIPMAFAAETNHVPVLAWYLFLLNCIWIVIYDTLYAMVDREDDVKIGIKSTAILFGQYDKRIIAALQCVLVAGFMYLGIWQQLTWPYYSGVVLIAALCVYQQWLIKDRKPALCFVAFLNNNYLGMVIFLGIVFAYLI